MSYNVKNVGYKEGYPLFLGQELGIIDTVNCNYPQLEELYQDQLAQIWNEFEVDLTQDKMDMINVPSGTKDLMVKTLMWQTAADSLAARSIIESLGDYITNSELNNLATLWSFFEVIHSRTYSHIIKQTFVDPNEAIEELYKDAQVNNRLEIIKDTFDAMSTMRLFEADEHQLKCAILKTLTALFGLESISFMSSFAVTFAITETGVFQGIGQLVKLICRDEVLHTRFGYEIFKILLSDPEWQAALAETKEERLEILNSLIEQEIDWTNELFNDDRKVLGLNPELLKEYVMYMARPVYTLFGEDFPYKVVTENPLPYMDSYIDASKVQAAAQEIQLTSYNTGYISDEPLDDLDLTL